MKKCIQTILFFIILFPVQFYNSQEVKIKGYVKQSGKELLRISVVINDTINKIAKIDSTDFTRRNKIYKEKKIVTSGDNHGYFTIFAKPTDSLYFRFGRFYLPEKYAVSDLLKRDKILIEPKNIPCIPYKKCDQKAPSKLYSFVGRKINVSNVSRSKYCGISLDSEYKAEYEIEQEFGDHYPDSKITFTAYDHNSMYAYDFRNYDNVLIFVGEYCGDLIQLKYQFFPVYKTTNGRWATPVDTRMENYYKSDKFVPKNITFDKSADYDLINYTSAEQIAQLKKIKFPEKYYKMENRKAIPIMGRYAEDLVKLWNEISNKNK